MYRVMLTQPICGKNEVVISAPDADVAIYRAKVAGLNPTGAASRV